MDLDDDVSPLRPAVSPLPTDVGLAEEFAARHTHHLRYVAEWSCWMRYVDGRWIKEKTLFAFDEVRRLCVEFSCGLNKPHEVKAVLSTKTVAAVEKLAKADRRIAATAEQWDRNLWLLNTPDGTVDLKIGKLRPHDSNDYITKIAAVAPGGKCPLWEAHLKRVLPNEATRKFLQRYFGSACTGDMSDEQLIFAYGKGQNGKGTTIDTVADVLGDYHCAVSVDTFIASDMERHPTELAKLVGVRFATAHEIDQGRRWREALINQLTGGGKITARFMRQDFFDFVPQCKLCFSGNHRPRLRSINVATKRRFNLVPFNVVIAETEKDQQLKIKLRAERGGILQWLIDGCLEWQGEGLNAPNDVKEATGDYFKSEDVLADWIEVEFVRNQGVWMSSEYLFSLYKHWCEENGE
jgi:putative DNA primase/helicase